MSAGSIGAAGRAARQRTLGLAIALSAFAPIATGYAAYVSRSTTQIADFLRRSVELVAMIISWAAFRYVTRHDVEPDRLDRIERRASRVVAAAMATSAAVIGLLAATRIAAALGGTIGAAGAAFGGGATGSVIPGLVIAVLGAIVNASFWLRYRAMTNERYDAIIASQATLYAGKTAVDGCVVLALATVAVAPGRPESWWVDTIGSIAVALYLSIAAARVGRSVEISPRTQAGGGAVQP